MLFHSCTLSSHYPLNNSLFVLLGSTVNSHDKLIECYQVNFIKERKYLKVYVMYLCFKHCCKLSKFILKCFGFYVSLLRFLQYEVFLVLVVFNPIFANPFVTQLLLYCFLFKKTLRTLFGQINLDSLEIIDHRDKVI